MGESANFKSAKNLGDKKYKSPMADTYEFFVTDDDFVAYNVWMKKSDSCIDPRFLFEMAGPRKEIFFDPKKTRIAIVTCGGLCPGINDVIRSIVMHSMYHYNVDQIFGINFGYLGLKEQQDDAFVPLTPSDVEEIHRDGGTILGSSRGGADDVPALVNVLERKRIDILYCIGGDGTLRAAHDISVEALDRGYRLSVIGIPKTIDNDINYVDRSFGFETAFSVAVDAIAAAHVEAKGAMNGIGLVKLMGRDSGFIAANAALAMNDVNVVLVPEIPLTKENFPHFLEAVENRMRMDKVHKHAVICVAEGAGQDLFEEELEEDSVRDTYHNSKKKDIGIFLKEKIQQHMNSVGIDITLKYIDPSYMIRSLPANANDSLFCELFGRYAVHAGMAGKTDILIGHWNNYFTHVPIEMAVFNGENGIRRKQIDPHGTLWQSVVEATGQPVNWDE